MHGRAVSRRRLRGFTGALVVVLAAWNNRRHPAARLPGVLFTVLRLRSGSLLAPVLLHLATNSLGTPAAAAALRLQ